MLPEAFDTRKHTPAHLWDPDPVTDNRVLTILYSQTAGRHNQSGSFIFPHISLRQLPPILLQ